MRQDGFTLIQLLLVIGLIGLLVQLAAPGFRQLVVSQQRQVVAFELASGLRSARAEAILQQRDVLVQAIDDDWGLGWWMIVDSSGKGVEDPNNRVLLERRLGGAVPVVGNTRLLTRARFVAQGWPAYTGTGPGNGTLHICEQGAAVSHWRVVMANSGRVRVESGALEQALCGTEFAGER